METPVYVSEINGAIEVLVTNEITKSHYFDDCEVVGWLLLPGPNGTGVYHLYRRGGDLDQPCIFPDDPLNRKKERDRILQEVDFQERTGENPGIKSRVMEVL